MSLLSIPSSETTTSENILSMCHRLKMFGIHTPPIPAQMIEL